MPHCGRDGGDLGDGKREMQTLQTVGDGSGRDIDPVLLSYREVSRLVFMMNREMSPAKMLLFF